MNEKGKNPGCVKNVGCIVKECRYHSDRDVCRASQITVSNEKAQNKAETFCSTFENRAEF